MFALGIVSVFDQILDEMDDSDKDALFGAYVKSLGEDASTYRKDADELTELAEACSSPEDLTPSSSGGKVCTYSFIVDSILPPFTLAAKSQVITAYLLCMRGRTRILLVGFS